MFKDGYALLGCRMECGKKKPANICNANEHCFMLRSLGVATQQPDKSNPESLLRHWSFGIRKMCNVVIVKDTYCTSF